MSTEFVVHLPHSENRDARYYTENFFHYLNSVMNNNNNNTMSLKEYHVYYAIYYDGQVKNGGHTQFVLNTNNSDEIYGLALLGLRHIGASAHEKILEDMIELVKSQPAEIETTLNAPDFLIPPGFHDLDDRFFEASAAASIGDLASAWIERLPNLKIVSTREYLALIDQAQG